MSQKMTTEGMPYTIMIVEDEYWTAKELAAEVRDRGAVVGGPTSCLSKAKTMVEGAPRPDAVILDLQLRAEDAFSFADHLLNANIPFLLATGYEAHELPSRFKGIPHLVKPCSSAACIDAALTLAADRAPASPHRSAAS